MGEIRCPLRCPTELLICTLGALLQHHIPSLLCIDLINFLQEFLIGSDILTVSLRYHSLQLRLQIFQFLLKTGNLENRPEALFSMWEADGKKNLLAPTVRCHW